MQAFIANHERALEELFGDVENHSKFDACLMWWQLKFLQYCFIEGLNLIFKKKIPVITYI